VFGLRRARRRLARTGLKSHFDTIPQDKLMTLLQEKISD
jgi:hypothetical protein